MAVSAPYDHTIMYHSRELVLYFVSSYCTLWFPIGTKVNSAPMLLLFVSDHHQTLHFQPFLPCSSLLRAHIQLNINVFYRTDNFALRKGNISLLLSCSISVRLFFLPQNMMWRQTSQLNNALETHTHKVCAGTTTTPDGCANATDTVTVTEGAAVM